MAQPVNTYSSYDMRGIREDLTDVIHDVSPTDTPFYSSAAKTRATNTYHEWQTDAIRTSAVNAHLEGDDTIATVRTPTQRLGNYTQIFKDAAVVTGTDAGLNKAGRGDEMDYQLVKIGREIRLDIERAMLANQARAVGSDTTPRLLAGVPAWLFTNTINQTGNGGADPIGDGTNARTDDGTPVAFSQTRMNQCLQSIWENSNGEKNLTVLLNAFQMNVALGFTGNNNQRNTVAKGAVANVVDVYMTPWGAVDFVMSREIRARDVLVLDMSMFKIPVLRGFETEPLAKMGDSEKRQIVTELTLESSNQRASGGVFDNTTA
jgi:hypothetical protein